MPDDSLLARIKETLAGLRSTETHMDIEVSDLEGVPRIALEGDLDHHTSPHLRTLTSQVLGEGEPIVLLDMNRVTYMDSGGMSLLFDIVRTVRGTGWVGIVAPGPNIARLLQITGLQSQAGLRVFPDDEAARRAIRQHVPRE